MPLEIITLQLGPMDNNSYLAADPLTREAAVIDPSFESQVILETIEQHGWDLTAVWLTHAHFDHIAGVKTLIQAARNPLPVGLHPADLPLWRQGGGARLFGMQVEPGPEPALLFRPGQILRLGSQMVEVRHTPGHTPGHLAFYSAESQAVFTGDLIFYRGIGRTDLPGGDHGQLIRSIREQILTLPPETRLLSGHGPETTVQAELAENPFL